MTRHHRRLRRITHRRDAGRCRRPARPVRSASNEDCAFIISATADAGSPIRPASTGGHAACWSMREHLTTSWISSVCSMIPSA